jgi:hypothetical protein
MGWVPIEHEPMPDCVLLLLQPLLLQPLLVQPLLVQLVLVAPKLLLQVHKRHTNGRSHQRHT